MLILFGPQAVNKPSIASRIFSPAERTLIVQNITYRVAGLNAINVE